MAPLEVPYTTPELLRGKEIHEKWRRTYRGPENEPFFTLLFDRLAAILRAGVDASIVDLGCGSCAHSVRLAERGFRVIAADRFQPALAQARTFVREKGLEERVQILRADLCSLPFQDASVHYAFCWGVLMHVPAVDSAICEIARVLAPRGLVVLGEGNMHSLQCLLYRGLNRLFGVARGGVLTPAGIEYWTSASSGSLLTRHANIRWIVAACARSGLRLRVRAAGQFTELYARLPSPTLRRVVHLFNNLWFRSIRWAPPAFGNVLLLEKPPASGG